MMGVLKGGPSTPSPWPSKINMFYCCFLGKEYVFSPGLPVKFCPRLEKVQGSPRGIAMQIQMTNSMSLTCKYGSEVIETTC